MPNQYLENEGIKLGLTRSQVKTRNFGEHTITAIKDIQKRTKELSSSEAFEMVKGKSYEETVQCVKAYLDATKKPQKPITEMTLIRVLVNTGRGFGHQRAAITLMQKLRELGFSGVFDIQCKDRLGARLFNSRNKTMYINFEPLVSRQLKSMIPDFDSTESAPDGVKVVNRLGAVKISSLPDLYENEEYSRFPKADLAVCAADDCVFYGLDKIPQVLHANSYIGLEPTDWYMGSCFVVDPDGIVSNLPPASTMRLSSIAGYQLPDISSISLTLIEQKILDITTNTAINSQLVYGLYPELNYDRGSGQLKETGNLDEAEEMKQIIEANLILSQKQGKPSILFLPQAIAIDAVFLRKIREHKENVHTIDLTREDIDLRIYHTGDIVVVHTGRLQQTVFDHLMLQGTTLPPVIEGCNSIETCESAGKPYIHSSAKHTRLRKYEVEKVDKQELHFQACLCLETGNPAYQTQLIRYMEESLALNPELIAYHTQRKEDFFRRPDACELAFNELGIQYEKTRECSDSVTTFFSHKKASEDEQTQRKGPSTGCCTIS